MFHIVSINGQYAMIKKPNILSYQGNGITVTAGYYFPSTSLSKI